MKGTLVKNSLKLTLAAASMSFMFLLTGGLTAKAESIELVPFDKMSVDDLHKAPGWEDKNPDKMSNYKYINYLNAVLTKYDTITFKSGETFNLEAAMLIPSDKAITINATGATIISEKGTVANADFSKTDFNAIQGLTITGGTWKAKDAGGNKSSAFKIAHGKNITFKDMDIQNTNCGGHSIEIVACKDVVIDHCNIAGQGSAGGREEQVQIDLAAPGTAGNFVPSEALNGATCQNITIQNCTITGNKGVGINADGNISGSSKKKANGGKYPNKYHKNITIANNTITGTKGEGVMAYNVIGLKIQGNEIKSEASAKKGNFSAGIHVLNQGKGKKMTVTIKGNTVEGGKHAIFVGTNGAKIKKATVTNNSVSNDSKNEAVAVTGCSKQKVKKNK